MSEIKVPLVKLCIGEEEVEAASEVLRSGWLLQGPRVREFEVTLENYFGVKHAVCVSSCTAALHLSVLSLKLWRSRVICPDFTFPTTANVIVHASQRPIFVDVDPATFTLNPLFLGEAITRENGGAVIPVHLFGEPCAVDEILEMAYAAGLTVIWDAAGAFGAEYMNRKIGSFPDLTCFSFDTRKILTCGEGGVILTSDDEKADWLRMARSHGSNLETWKIHRSPTLRDLSFPISGFNYRMMEVQAAIGLVQLKKLSWILERRRKVAKLYDDLLDGVEGVIPPYVPEHVTHTYQSYVITLQEMDNVKFIEEMRKRGVQASYASRALHLEPCFKGLPPSLLSLDVSESLVRHTAALPIYPTMEETQAHYVVDELKEILES